MRRTFPGHDSFHSPYPAIRRGKPFRLRGDGVGLFNIFDVGGVDGVHEPYADASISIGFRIL